MKRAIAEFLICVVVVIFLAGCSAEYSEADFIGKTSAQIESEFGLFDCCGMPASENGLYQNTACGYTIQESKIGFFGTSPELLLFIAFDENGVARACYEDYRPGG